MMIVADANLIAYLWIPSEFSLLADQVLAKDRVWAVPLLWRSEFRNVLALSVRRQKMSYEQAVATMELAENQLSDQEYAIGSPQVLRWVFQSNLSAYDAEYLALAEELETVVVTSDRRLIGESRGHALSMDCFLHRTD